MATTIPVYVADDAAARVDELGMRAEPEQMIEHAKQAVPGLQLIRVILENDPEWPENEPQLVIWAKRDIQSVDPSGAAVNMDLCRWMAETLTTEVSLQFVILAVYGDVDRW
jgi:hypothetical protein